MEFPNFDKQESVPPSDHHPTGGNRILTKSQDRQNTISLFLTNAISYYTRDINTNNCIHIQTHTHTYLQTRTHKNTHTHTVCTHNNTQTLRYRVNYQTGTSHSRGWSYSTAANTKPADIDDSLTISTYWIIL